MKIWRMFHSCLVVFICLSFIFIHEEALSKSLRVALYPYVPRLDQFKKVIAAEWQKVQPDVSIEWVDGWYGGYSNNPQASYDVYVFDAIFLDYFKSQNWLFGLQKSQVSEFDDLLDYAATGIVENNLVYAMPQLGCGSILFYHKTDAALAKANNLQAVTSAIGSCVFYGETPKKNVGLMLDFSGGTTNACNYIESVHERLNQFPVSLPRNPGEVDQTAISYLQSALASSSFMNALYEGDAAYQRADWFNQGIGRAYVGFTESMSELDPPQLNNIAMKPMPWSDNAAGNQTPLFYADLVGIHPATQSRGNTTLAIALTNLITSTDVIVKCFGADGSNGPQYLMPVRHTVFQQLGEDFPIYKQMYTMVTGVQPILFNLGKDSRAWLQSMKSNIKSMVLADPQCYCDIEAGPIWSNSDAQQECPDVCQDYGGWNGQWTTTLPGQMSVCECDCGAVKSNY